MGTGLSDHWDRDGETSTEQHRTVPDPVFRTMRLAATRGDV